MCVSIIRIAIVDARWGWRMNDLVRKADVLEEYSDLYWMNESLLNFRSELDSVYDRINQLKPVEPERKTGRLSNKEWIDFLVEQFNVSRTSAKDMLHGMMQVKREDNFKKQFSGAKIEVENE